MITSITGQLVTATPLTATIEVGGFGYEVHIPVTTAERLPSLGQQAKLHTVAVYREDSQTLYGFSTEEERNFFRLLVEKVTGVGPKMALSVLSKLSLATLKGAIAAGDIGLLSKCPGIGKKTAERLVIELRDYLNPAELAGAAASVGYARTYHLDRVLDQESSGLSLALKLKSRKFELLIGCRQSAKCP